MLRIITAGVAALMSITACGGDDSGAAPTTTAAAATRSSQAASIVAPLRNNLSEALEFHRSCTSFECVTGAAITARQEKMVLTAISLTGKLRAGEPFEEEVAQLVASTRAAATAVQDQWDDDVLPCLRDTPTMDACGDLLGENERLLGALDDQLDAWEPYL